MLAASLRFADCYLLIIVSGMRPQMPVTPPAPTTPPLPPRATPTPPPELQDPLVDPTLTFSTTPSLSIPTPDDHEVARLKAQVEALSRQLQERQKDPVSTPAASTAVRQTRKRPASQAYTEALGIERESADEREGRRVEKSTKKARTKGAMAELDKMLGIDKDKGKKKK
jgi:hypothetical protein